MLKIFKGYEKEELEKIKDKALIKNEIEEKYDIKDYKILAEKVVQEVALKLIQLKKEELWITYEEFSVCHETLISLAKTLNIEVVIVDNNKYYNTYPFQASNTKLVEKIYNRQNNDIDDNEENLIYAYVYKVNQIFFIQYHNYEYDYADYIKMENRYKVDTSILPKSDSSKFVFNINEDIENYIENIIKMEKYNSISISLSVDTNITREIKRNLVAYIKSEQKEVFEYEEKSIREQKREEFKRIAKEVIGIPNFVDFKKLNFYKNPLEGNEIIQISQENIINEITCQIDKAKEGMENKYYRDIFITAPTGAGKSVMFQIPAVYAAEKYQSVSIVISPLVELMNDQVENLQKRGYYRAARINSDINAVEREEIIKKVDGKEIDIIYISPEALLSYSIESIIGTREISTVIIDEAHIVTTWGQGFRPDYWYLGTYIERLRKSRYKKGVLDLESKIYDFPICTFTATSVFGGEDDGVSEISKSLYLIDPVKFIGEVKRKDIKFDINVIEDKLNRNETEEQKAIDLERRIRKWDADKEKALVYFPYNSIATEAYKAVGNFDNLKEMREKIAIYTGQVDKSLKKYESELYKSGQKNIMFATKAFGMGIDIKDIKHVYHYAISGNLNDYLQEIGRAARDKEIIGYAHMDYYEKDINYTKALFGMSAIKQSHIEAILRILNNVYQTSKKRNMLITPQMFETVFPNNKNLENAVKTALLNIEKDMLAHYRIPVIITRPRSIFTKAYAVIERNIEKELLEGEFGRYFKKVGDGRNKENESNVLVTDLGDVFSVDLKKMWEEKFSKMTFQSFKYSYYMESEKILGNYAENVYPRNKIQIEVIEDKTLVNIKERLIENINNVCEILSKFQKRQGEFTLAEFEKELIVVYKDKVLAKNIANAYFKCIELDSSKDFRNIFYTKKQVGDIVKYRILNSNFRTIAEELVYKNKFLKEINGLNVNSLVKYKTNKKEIIKPILKILNLLSLFNLIQYDMYGGENPEIFIRINEPNRIKKIVDGSIEYKNNIVLKAAQKHKRDNEIFLKFIKEMKTDEERWDYIEKYFLGEDVLKEL